MSKLASNIHAQPESLTCTLRHQCGDGAAAMTQAAALLRSGKKIVITGIGASLFASIPLQYFLCSLGLNAVAIEAGELLHYLNSVWKDAVVLIVSRSGESVEIARLLERMKGTVPIIGVTNESQSRLSRSAEVSLYLLSLQDEMVAIQTYTGTFLTLHLLGSLVASSFEAAAEDIRRLLPAFASLVETSMKILTEWDVFLTPDSVIYDLGERVLLVNDEEAKHAREIFQQYLKLGSVFDLYEHLIRGDIRSKVRLGPTGRASGGAVLSSGTLYHLLSNPLYMGEIAHKGVTYPGMHQAIVDEVVWQKPADLLKENRVRRTKSTNLPSERLLLGLLFDEDGNRFTPSHASKKGRRYCYYISRAAVECKRSKDIRRIPALEIEQLVATRLRSLLSNQMELSQWFAFEVSNVRFNQSIDRAIRTLVVSPEAKDLFIQLAAVSSVKSIKAIAQIHFASRRVPDAGRQHWARLLQFGIPTQHH